MTISTGSTALLAGDINTSGTTNGVGSAGERQIKRPHHCLRSFHAPDSCHFASVPVPAARFSVNSVRGSINPAGDKLYIADGVSLD
jgi:hypothetical protein